LNAPDPAKYTGPEVKAAKMRLRRAIESDIAACSTHTQGKVHSQDDKNLVVRLVSMLILEHFEDSNYTITEAWKTASEYLGITMRLVVEYYNYYLTHGVVTPAKGTAGRGRGSPNWNPSGGMTPDHMSAIAKEIDRRR
jgi:hypothetical protein